MRVKALSTQRGGGAPLAVEVFPESVVIAFSGLITVHGKGEQDVAAHPAAKQIAGVDQHVAVGDDWPVSLDRSAPGDVP